MICTSQSDQSWSINADHTWRTGRLTAAISHLRTFDFFNEVGADNRQVQHELKALFGYRCGVSPQRYAPLPFITYTLHACSTHVCSVQSHVIAKNHSSINYAMRVGLSSGDRVAKVPAAPVTRADTLAPSLIAADRRLNRPRMQFNHELAFCTHFSTPFFPTTTVARSGVKGLKIGSGMQHQQSGQSALSTVLHSLHAALRK
jgi:hypothetical protein